MSQISIYDYKYASKEWQDEMNLNVYDHGARNYDPATGRWNVIDVFAEKYYNQSPYVYSNNNPVFFIDFNGMDPMPGPFTGRAWISPSGIVTAYRITAEQRYAIDIQYSIAIAGTGWMGTAFGVTTSLTSKPQGTWQQKLDQRLMTGLSGSAEAWSQFVSSSYGKGFVGKEVISAASKLNFLVQWTGTALAVLSDSNPTSQEFLEKWTFNFAESMIEPGKKNINIVQDGLFQVASGETIEGIENKLNIVLAGLLLAVNGMDFDLTTEEGQRKAEQYFQENSLVISYLIKFLNGLNNNDFDSNKIFKNSGVMKTGGLQNDVESYIGKFGINTTYVD